MGRDRRQVHATRRFEGLEHTEVQLQQNQYKVGFYPSGSWLENEQAKDTPAGFEYQLMPHPERHRRGQAARRARIRAAAGEGYFVAAKGKNPQGGLEYLRHMLSKAGAKGFTEKSQALTVVTGAAEGLDLSPGLTPATAPR